VVAETNELPLNIDPKPPPVEVMVLKMELLPAVELVDPPPVLYFPPLPPPPIVTE
jgi:hypothetical protein